MNGLHGPRRYSVHHLTEYSYEEDVTMSFGRAMLRPRDTPQQRVDQHEVAISPEPDVLEESRDAFGNYSHYVEISNPHTTLAVTKTSTIDVEWPLPDLGALNAWTVAEAAAAICADPAIDPFERAAFQLPSRIVTLGETERGFAEELLPSSMPLGEAIETAYRRIYAEFTYTKGVTSISTTLPEVIAAREGVCQDFAHLAVASFRAVGIPARYVSGYIETSAPAGQVKLEGSDASHAWASVMVPGGGWVDLDPTNDHLADSRYLVTAWGRDFRDVSPLKGIVFTDGGSSKLRVAVTVKRLD
ncbi:transglutaminase family protein [Aestuariimicrobium ganziense]|uniref:transglutaminase family protein n=1 Tax=Aestuariimicrobium ganziense TaxID=2773677 RepID=UPI001943987E|nr:transglutaminase family protein [Aestuariimicrobium ganziense]